MFDNVQIKTTRFQGLIEFLEEKGFQVEKATDDVIAANRIGEFPIFINIHGGALWFECDLGSTKGIEDMFGSFLDLNTEILPVSLGINSVNPDDPRLVLLESREAENLDENEFLSVMDAMELAVDKVEALLAKKG